VRRSAANAPVRHGRNDEADKRAWAARERATRGGGRRGSLTSGVGLSGGGAARAAGPCGPWKERGGKSGRGAGWARMGPAKGGKGFSLFCFLFPFFLFLFWFLSILFFF
jgi:hypothetical protein